MKTNQVMIRTMGDFSVYQRTSDAMFNATELLKQWNAASGMKKEISKYFDNPSTKEFIQAIVKEEFPDTQKSANGTLSMVYIKTRGGKERGGTWMHPLLFIDFAMWLNPSFKVKVLKFVYDQLVQYRNEVGDTYREMCERIASISERKHIAENIANVAKALNHIVYGAHEKEIRNKRAEEDSMRELLRLQIKVSELIKENFIGTYGQLINYLRNLWTNKYQPKVLA